LKKTFIDENKHPIVVVAESDPPIKYLINLRDFISENPDNEIINLDIDPIEENWKPINLHNEKDISDEILKLIENQPITIIQGPPGTGKSYLAAKLCSNYIKRNKTIAVAALANKALTEIATQDGLIDDLAKGKIFKTNISSRERKQYPTLKKVDEFLPKQGELLLTSYYKLSEYSKKFLEHGKRFDLIIIEEASQAFLATIALFSHFAEKILIIGDHKQLTPIVSLGEKELNRIHPKLTRVINGLETTTFNKPEISYRLTKTRRLTSKSAALTGIYYHNELESISSLNGKIVHQTSYQSLFDKEGGVSIAYLHALQIGFKENDLIKLIIDIAISLLGTERNESITICTSKVADEAKLFQAYNLVSHDFTNINISTVHRIQGVTTDYTIFYMPLDAPHMDLNDNLFNVASSRAKKGTLIITKKHISLMVGKSKEIEEFLKNCTVVTENFMNALVKDVEF
jgi:AAA domain